MIKNLLNSPFLSEEEREELANNILLAEHGQSEAQYALGRCCESSSNLLLEEHSEERYKNEAVKWYRKAANQGHLLSQKALGNCYFYGRGVSQDDQEAVKWYMKAAEQGDSFAQYQIGYCYLQGRGVKRDYREAAKWYLKALDQGYILAEYGLGKCFLDCYMIGQGTHQDYLDALHWLSSSASRGNSQALRELEKVYLSLKDTQQDMQQELYKTIKHYNKSFENDDVDSKEESEIFHKPVGSVITTMNVSEDYRVAHASVSPSPYCITYEPCVNNPAIFSYIRREDESDVVSPSSVVYCSTFAPAEVKRSYRMLVQVYLHLYEDTERVIELARESQKNAKRRDYCPLNCKLKIGDKIDVVMSFYGEKMLKSERKSVVWQGSFTKCSFDYLVPSNIKDDELFCTATLTVNEAPVGEMSFFTKIVKSPRKLNPEVFSRKFRKVFISYSHNDEKKVKFLAEAFKIQEINCFFDREYLKPGVVFPQEIQDYIKSADLFVLCWSKNASKSEYVEKERLMALKRAFPQVVPKKAAKLSIYPISIGAQVELPSDMKDIYHFGVIG